MRKISISLSAVLLAASFTGCSSTAKRAAGLGVGAAAGGGLGYAVSHGNATATGAGAAGGAVLSALAMGKDTEAEQEGFDKGYVQGQSDAIKRHYFLRHDQEAKPLEKKEGKEVIYVVPGPEVAPDGTKLEPHQVTVRVIE